MTTDGLDETHAQVALGQLEADLELGPSKVFDSIVPKPTPAPPWVLVYTTVAWPRDGVGTSLAGQQVTVTTTINTHAVGETAAAARALATQVRSSLLNIRPVIAGRNCSLIKQADSQPPALDESLSTPYFDAIAVFDFTSVG